jgi:dipeptidyl aminopeptidase/acylaminoacyl peptidase
MLGRCTSERIGIVRRASPVSAIVLATLVLPLSAGGRDAALPRDTISVVSSDDSRIVFLIKPGTGAVARVRAPDKILDTKADLSRDGTRIAIGGLRGLWTFRRRGGGARLLGLDSKRFSPGWATWSPSGRHLAFERGEALYTVRVNGGKTRKIFGGPAYAPDWSPTGSFIVFVRNPAPLTGAGTIHSIGTDGRNLRSIVRGGHPDVSPDGARIAFARRDGVYVVPVAGGRPRRVVRNAEHPEWSPDGKYLAFTRAVSCSEVGCNGRVFVIRAKGGRARALGPPIFEIGPLSWSL